MTKAITKPPCVSCGRKLKLNDAGLCDDCQIKKPKFKVGQRVTTMWDGFPSEYTVYCLHCSTSKGVHWLYELEGQRYYRFNDGDLREIPQTPDTPKRSERRRVSLSAAELAARRAAVARRQRKFRSGISEAIVKRYKMKPGKLLRLLAIGAYEAREVSRKIDDNQSGGK